MQKSLAALISAVIALTIPYSVQAGAWLQESGETQVIINYNYLSTDKFFNPSGDKFSNTKFTKSEVMPYIEYGLDDDWTIGGSASLQSVSSNITALNDYQLAYIEVFGRYKLYSKDEYVISLEPIIKIPIEQDVGINPEDGKPIPELKISYGQAISIFTDYDSFSDVSVKYRHRSYSDIANMLKLDASFGIRPFSENPVLLLGQSFYEKTLTNIQASPNAGNYDLWKLQLSAAYEYDKNLTFQLGAYSNIIGRNTASGQGILLSTWVNF